MLYTLSHTTPGAKLYSYPHDELERLWRLLLLNQFHDVLPGTSINIVYNDAMQYYKGIVFRQGIPKNGTEITRGLSSIFSFSRGITIN